MTAKAINKTITIDGLDYNYWRCRNIDNASSVCTFDLYRNVDSYNVHDAPVDGYSRQAHFPIPPNVTTGDPVSTWIIDQIIANDAFFSDGTAAE